MSDESTASAEQQYSDTLGSSGNIYAPFASKMDWEVARWAKLRGSGSTAFTDLLKVEGVRGCGTLVRIKHVVNSYLSFAKFWGFLTGTLSS
jgi:hypothetical protein